MEKYSMIIAGQEVAASSGRYFDVLDPGTQEAIAQVPYGDRDDAKRAIDAAKEAFDSGMTRILELAMLTQARRLQKDSRKIIPSVCQQSCRYA